MLAGVLAEPGRLELREVPRPDPRENEVVVRVRAALTCGTDLKTWRRGHPKFPTPTPLGHEGAGDIASVGKGIEDWHEGDAVMFAPTGPCDGCFFCCRGQRNLCETLFSDMVLGTYGEYVRVPASVVRSNLHPKPPSLSYEKAAFLEPLACVVHALAGIRVGPGDTAVVLGGGGFALLHLLVLRSRGCGSVWTVARRSARAALARHLGAGRALEADATSVREIVFEGTGGRGADLVVECTGDPAVWEAAIGLARAGGRVVLFGGCPAGSEIRIDTGRIHYDQVEIRSPFHLDPDAVLVARDLLVDGVLPLEPLLTRRAPLRDLVDVFERLDDGDDVKVVIEP